MVTSFGDIMVHILAVCNGCIQRQIARRHESTKLVQPNLRGKGIRTSNRGVHGVGLYFERTPNRDSRFNIDGDAPMISHVGKASLHHSIVLRAASESEAAHRILLYHFRPQTVHEECFQVLCPVILSKVIALPVLSSRVHLDQVLTALGECEEGSEHSMMGLGKRDGDELRSGSSDGRVSRSSWTLGRDG